MLLGSLLACHHAFALPSFDPFADATANGGTTYVAGDALTNQSNPSLFSPWFPRGASVPGTQPLIAAANLGYAQMPPSSGNSASFQPANSMSAALDLSLPSAHTNTVYASFLLKITDITAVPNTPVNNPFAAFGDDPSATFIPNQINRLGTRLLTRKVGLGYVLGTSRSASTADYVYEPDAAAHNINDVLFVVMAFQREAAVRTNISVWINPPVSSFGSNQPPTPTLIASTGLSSLNAGNARVFALLCQFTTAPTGVIDELRISTNDWSFVTGGDPAITQNPANQTLPAGGNATFTVAARGTPTLTYQWVKDGTTILADGGNISGATTTTLHVNNLSGGDVGTYAAFVTNGFGNFTRSASAVLAFADPAITNQPASRTNNFGTTATFQVAASGTGPFTYQWHKESSGDLSDGGNITGSHSNILALTSVTYPDGGNYSVTVSNALGATAQSVTATLTVKDPYIVAQPVSVTNNAGSNVTFHVVADGSGAPGLTYQWRKDGNLISDGGNRSGTSTDTLSLSGITSADEGFYTVDVTGSFNSTDTSIPATLTVISPAAIVAQPAPRAVPLGATATFAVGVTGTEPLSYQWRRNGTSLPLGTSRAYTITNVQPSDLGGYSVVVSNSLTVVTSSTASLTIVADLHLYATNLSIIRVGNGDQTLTDKGNSMFLDQFTPNGTYLSTLNIPDSGTNALITLGPTQVPSPASVTGTTMSRSADGRFLVVAGYNTAVGFGGQLNTTTAAAVPRGIALFNSSAQYNLALSSTDSAFNSTFFRSGVTDGTNNYWGAGRNSSGYYFGFDAAPVSIQTTFGNMRSMALFNGNIYGASAVSGNSGILVLPGMPTVATAPTVLFSGSTGTSDMEVSPDGNLIYVADDRAAPSGGIQRWEFDGNSWNLAYTLTGELPTGARYVTATFSGSNPVVYAVSKESTEDNNRIVIIQDTGASSTGTTVAYAGVNQNFRGLRFGPVESASARPQLSFALIGNSLVLSWSGSFSLVSATNVTGPYIDVPAATSPYTNSAPFDARRFYGLRQ
jgi:hypothetical protein